MKDPPVGISSRREAREEALGLLYELEVTGESLQTALSARVVPLEEYSLALIEGVTGASDEIDRRIGAHLRGWTVDRLAVVDRVLARIATWELYEHPDVPTGVVLSEAVELASQYCGEESPRFLNGVLSAVAAQARGDPQDTHDPHDTHGPHDTHDSHNPRDSQERP